LKGKPRKRDSEKSLVYRIKKNGLDPRHELGQLRQVATAPFAEDQTFDKRIQLLNKHTELLDVVDQLSSSKVKKVL